MKIITRDINKYPNREKDFLNFALLPWYEQRLEMVKETGDAERLAKYDGLDPLEMVIEYPTAVFRNKGHFRSTVVARKNGLCFPDANVKFVNFERFLGHIDPDHNLYGNPDTPDEISISDLTNIASSTESFPSDPSFRLTKIKNSVDYALLISCDEYKVELDLIYSKLFDGYKFEKITGSLSEASDPEFPTKEQTDINGYSVGKVTLADTLLENKSVNFILFDIRIIKMILGVNNYTYNGNYFYNDKIAYSGAVK